MKKNMIKKIAAAMTAISICMATTFSSFAGNVSYMNEVGGPYYDANVYVERKDYDLISNYDAIIELLYRANGTTTACDLGVSPTSYEEAYKIGCILYLLLHDYKDLEILQYYQCESISIDGNTNTIHAVEPDQSKIRFYLYWANTEDHTEIIEQIKASYEEAKRIASTVPEGTNDEKLVYIYNYMRNMSAASDYNNSSLYDQLILKKGCCRGDASAIYIISALCGLPVGCMYYTSSQGYHVCNYSYSDDGTIKYTDAAAGRRVLADDYWI